jgi:hypothetical protein
MTLPRYLDLSEMARAVGASSVIEQVMEQQRAEREQFLRPLAATAADDLYRMLGGAAAVESIIQQERFKRDHALDSYRQLFGQSAFDLQTNHALGSLTSAVEAARLAGAFELPDLLEQYRVTDVSLAAQLVDAHRLSWWEDSCAEVLNAHSALSAMFDRIDVLGRDAWSAIDSVLSDPWLELHTVRQARELLGISGLLRPPLFRILTRKEKRRTIRLLIRDNAMSAEVRKAQGLVHRNEKVLRVLIAQCMEGAYGEDWAKERLTLCGCKKLLGRPLEGDESVLDHADYKHYELIMCHDEHFEAVFAVAYEDVDALRQMIGRLGQLRARSHHGRTFTPKDYRELVTLWRAMEAGFECLIDDVVIDS